MPNRFASPLLLLATVTLASCATQPASDGSYQRFMQLAGDLRTRGDNGSAAVLYEKATQQPDAQIDAWLKLGETRLASGDARGAERAYQRALELKPASAAALLGVGTAQLREGKLERAVTSLTEACANDNQPEALNRLGVAQILRGKAGEAEAAFTQSLALQPDNLDTRSNLALAYALAGNSRLAMQSVQALSESPRALPRHQRNALLITVLAGHEQDLRTRSLEDIAPDEFDTLLTEARRIKAIQDPRLQARELGLIDTR